MSPTPIPSTIPHGRTARRLEWSHLPPYVRRTIERRCGSPVVGAATQGAGFTPGFASVLVCEDGTRHFVKAASVKAQRQFADSYREEARKLQALPHDVPAPRLLWSIDDDWVVLGLEHVEARAPCRPWQPGDLQAALAMLAATAEALTPPPPGLALDGFADEFAPWPAYWDQVPACAPGLPHLAAHVDEAAALAARYREVSAGDTVVHTDVRDDNILLCADGRVLLCDWNWPVVGAAWLDSLLLLIGPRGDGLDVDAVLASDPVLAQAPDEAVDIVLALVTGYFAKAAGDPVPPTSPHIRDAQRWHRDVCWDWLCERRDWR